MKTDGDKVIMVTSDSAVTSMHDDKIHLGKLCTQLQSTMQSSIQCHVIISLPPECCNNYSISGGKRDRTIIRGTVLHLASYRHVDVYRCIPVERE